MSLSLQVVDSLGLAAMEGFQSLPRRGLEVGGFLMGTTRRDGEGIVVEVDQFEPLDSEHAVGPSYLLSATDRAALEARIRTLRSDGGVSIVGFYRSHTRKEFALTMEDVDVMLDYFSKPSMVFLLIHMQRGGPPMAGFSLWEGRNTLSMTPYAPFPFRRAALVAGGYEIRDRTPVYRPASFFRPASVFRPELEKPAEVQLSPPGPPDVARLRSVARRFLGAPQAPAELHMPLPNPELSAPKSAVAPAPTIAEVPAPTAVVVQPPQRPQNPQSAQSPPPRTNTLSRFLLQVRMRSRWGLPLAAGILLTAVFASVLHRTSISGESLRPAPLVARALPEASPAPGPAIVTPAQTTAPPEAAGAQPATTLRAGTAPETRDRRSGYKAPAGSTFAGIPPQPKPVDTPDSPQPLVLPDPPDVGSGIPADSALLSRGSEALKPRILNDPLVSVTIDRQPKSNGGLMRKLPLIGKRYKRAERADFVPPTPVREVPPVLPAELRQGLQHQVPIEVKVYVDRTGKVTYAELLSEPAGTNRDLASLAVFSARRWEFLPAHVGEEAVPAEVVLRFRFGPETH